MALNTITDQEKATVKAQIRAFAWPLAGVSSIAYIAVIYGFSQASSSFIETAQAYFVNPPDFSTCAPMFSAIVSGHIAFSSAATLVCLFLLTVTGISRYSSGGLLSALRNHWPMLLGVTFVASAPVYSAKFLTSGRLSSRWNFADFCASSWTSGPWEYIPYLIPWLTFSLAAIAFWGLEFVLSGHQQWLNSVSTDQKTAAIQLATRLEYGVIDQQTFDETAKKLKLK